MPAIPSTGPILITDLSTEFGGSAPHSISEYYRNGAFVPSNNTLVPTSGGISFSQFRGAINEIIVTSSAATNLDISTLFSSDWTSTVPKRLIIPSGVTIGGVGAAALTIPSNMAGTLEIDNAGDVIGFGGSANGGAGGDAIANLANGVTINNTGLLAAGGGGGGQGGQGGNGSVTSTEYDPSPSYYTSGQYGNYYDVSNHWLVRTGTNRSRFANTYRNHSSGVSTFTTGGWTYRRGPLFNYDSDGNIAEYGIRRDRVVTTTTSGGSGGSGGVGQGYNQTNTSGSGGSSGGTSAGTGGTGGSGSTYGNAGSTGSTGSNGNASSGSGGASGGAAGAAVSGTSVTMNNTGTVAGSVA